MTLQGKKITLHDMTLRDGMHPKRHLMTLAQMKDIATGLDEAGVPLIEVTHGDGLGGSSVNYGFPAHTDEEYLGAVIPLMKQAKVSALIMPRSATMVTLRTPKRWRMRLTTGSSETTSAVLPGQSSQQIGRP